jgi:arginyl-tRNA synthetase
MRADKFRQFAAEVISMAMGELTAVPSLSESIFDIPRIYQRLEPPKDPRMGNYAFPLFETAKKLGKNPHEINRQLTEIENRIVQENAEYSCLSFHAVGGFNNILIDGVALARETIHSILMSGNEYGSSTEGRGKNIVIDFSSPNIAKPFGVGHLRSTAIGGSLYRIFRKLGYTPVGINHLGDWGTQFGKMIVAFRRWGDDRELQKNAVRYLYDLYVRFHREEEAEPMLSEEARQAFKAMEDGDAATLALWQKFKDLSMAEFNKVYEMMGVHFDYQTGESFYNDKMEAVIERLKKAGLAAVSEGALVVDLSRFNLPACLLRKADGATLYATRDITGILYRWETFHFEKALYVVGSAQHDHFKQVFKVVELLEEAENIAESNRIAPRLFHVEFGWIKFQDEVMSTRMGNIIFLEEVFAKAIALAREKILEKNPDLSDIDRVARQIGIGAVIFADLSTRKEKDVNFDWNKVLNFEGETGPYLQYTHARLSSLLRHYGKAVKPDIDYHLLHHPEEERVIEFLYRFPMIVDEAAALYDPNVIVSHLLGLASAFNKVYQRKDAAGRIDKILSDDDSLTAARMALVSSVRTIINEGLNLLGIEAPEEM